jgi:site-specific recombinase XerD
MSHSKIPALPAQVKRQLAASWTARARKGLSASTVRAYKVDGEAFGAWARSQGHTGLPFPASPEMVAEFLEAQSEAGLSVATVRRRAATLAKLHRIASLPNPCAHELVRLTLKGIAKTRGTDQRQAAALTQRDADKIRARMGDRLKDARDVALMLVGRDLLSRSSELIALEVEHITPTTDGALVQVRRKKTHTETHTYFIGSEAAQAVAEWLKRANISRGIVFRSVNKGGSVSDRALSTRDIGRVLKAVAITGRLEHRAGISGHSLRVGMCQDLVAGDIDVASVMQAGGWQSARMVARYSAKIAARRGAVAKFYAAKRS